MARDPLADYDYHLPPERIAQEPPAERGSSRLLLLDRRTGRSAHHRFPELASFLQRGDLLVLNDTRVFPARLRARRRTGGKVEVLLLEPAAGGSAWRALGRPARALRPGEVLGLEGDPDVAFAVRGREGDETLVEVLRAGLPLGEAEVLALCELAGETPLPPYIRRGEGERRRAGDRERYQTVYARKTGAAAAPTAGLHFTPSILDQVRTAGAGIAHVTLHVGLGTFKPLTAETFEASTLHSERVEVARADGEEILRAWREGRRVIAVGTTAVRALESFALRPTLPFAARTDLFIKPGHVFRGTGALITNFHLPRSSLLALVAAFAGREAVLEAYREAVAEGYRFYSYGDAMMIV
jgi:S-adenosylmethionine:tRNA ribosyltransferase-isomerase